ncbi:MAG: metallophosphoesterase, partial [Crocinitomicaceae bacterium]|nr:metallophosphoesterase [Crocinitomicaceae bacterium]
MKSIFTFLSFFSIYCILHAQDVVRGPYLQSPTENSIVIKWRTGVASNSKVQYGTSLSNLNLVATNNTSTTEHTITLDNLNPATTYYYAVGSTSSLFTIPSDSFRFKTNPIPGIAVPT